MSAALAGIKVVDLSNSIGGQYCGRLLADYGAEVVLAEPEDGSPLRHLPPFSIKSGGKSSLLFLHLNTGKHSIRIESGAAGQVQLRDLLRNADVALLPAEGENAYESDLSPH